MARRLICPVDTEAEVFLCSLIELSIKVFITKSGNVYVQGKIVMENLPKIGYSKKLF